jgi:hypothetical protein
MAVIQDIVYVVKDIVNELVTLKGVYTYPIEEIPKPYPALSILYTGFTRPEDEDDMDYFVTDLKYQLTLYLPNDGRNMEERWDELNTLTWALLVRFAKDRTLGRNCRESIISSGEPVVDLRGSNKIPVGLGHTFDLVVRVETEEE